MTPDLPRRAEALFRQALGLDPADRPAFLDRECGDDAKLRSKLDEWLTIYHWPALVPEEGRDDTVAANTPRPDATADTPVDTGEARRDPGDPYATLSAVDDPYATVAGPGAGLPFALPMADFPAGELVAGRYRIRKELGEGGMGSVYLADQTQPVKRQVALKLIKAGMDSRTILARFESERQALALMDHPNIAKVLDAGTTAQGRPFFVMELVRGVPVTDYCDQHRLGLPERLGLFRQICSAVQHAHQKGIIHRDLKPTNILVEAHDGQPVPKVIDFGLAKAIGGLQLTEESLHSVLGTVAGTPLYMAPEQASFGAIDIDTRADIYSLGVILYELLTGSTPILRESLRKAAVDEMLRIIREVDPPTPSSRISTLDALPSVAATRQTEPARLGRFLRGDLDWVVMKALAKERQRRYDSPIALAQDIERFLNHEPVSAGPPTAAYRLRKFVRRNRTQVVAASLVLLALVGGIIGTTLGLLEARTQAAEANRQKGIAVEQRQEADKQKGLAIEQQQEADRQKGIAVERRQEAEKRLGQRDRSNAILLAMFKDLNPRGEKLPEQVLSTLLGERLDRAAAQLEEDAIDDPLGVARMQAALGHSQAGLGNYNQAIALLAKARPILEAQLGPDHPDAIGIVSDLGTVYQYAGRLDLAMPLIETALANTKARLGEDHPKTLELQGNLAAGYMALGNLGRALPLFEQTLPPMKAKIGVTHPSTLTLMNNLAQCYNIAAKYDQAIPLFEETMLFRKALLGEDNPATLTTMNNLAIALQATGRLDRSLPLFEETFRLTRDKLGPDHPETLNSMGNLADAYRASGQYDKAVSLQEQTLALKTAKLGAEHPETISAMANLGRALRFAGQAERAVATHEKALALMKVRFGPDHPETLINMLNLGNAYSSAGKIEQARAMFEATLPLARAKLGPDHPTTLTCMGNLGKCHEDMGHPERALPLYEEVLPLARARFGPDHPTTLSALANLAAAHRVLKQIDKAVPLYEAVLASRKAALGPDHPAVLAGIGNLAVAYFAAGRPDDAAPLLETFVAGQRKRLGADTLEFAAVLASTASDLLAERQFAVAEPLLRECLATREKGAADDWRTFNTRSMLGGALLGREDHAGAAPLLLGGYEGMKERAATIPPQGRPALIAAVDRLVALAEATGQDEDVKKWRDEKAGLAAEADRPKP